MILQEQFALEDVTRRGFGKAGMAFRRGGAAAQPLLLRLHHLSVVETNREVFVKGNDDARLGQGAAHFPDGLDAETDEVVKMHDIRLEIDQVAAERAG